MSVAVSTAHFAAIEPNGFALWNWGGSSLGS